MKLSSGRMLHNISEQTPHACLSERLKDDTDDYCQHRLSAR